MLDNVLLLVTDNKLITLLITMIGTIYWLIEKIRAELNDKKKEFMEKILLTDTSVQSFKNEIEEKLTQNPNLYRIELTRVLGCLDKYLGKFNLFSFQAFYKHFIFSLVYSFTFFYLVWLFEGNGQIGIYQFIPNTNRLSHSFIFLFELLLIYSMIGQSNEMYNFVKKDISKYNFSNYDTFEKRLIIMIGLGIILGIVASIGAIVLGGFIGITMVGGGIVGVVTIEIVMKRSVEKIIAIGIIIGGVLLALPLIDEIAILYLLFFLILPLVNAIFDYLSMIASRFFAQKILNTYKKRTIFIDIFLDIIVASLLFVALAFTLYYVIEFTNIHLIKDEALFIPIEHYKQLMFSAHILHPDVLWISLMFVSTLIPTFIHLYLFVYSLMAFVIVKPHLHQIVKNLEELDLENDHKKEQVAYALADYRLTGWLRVHNFFVSALAIGSCVLLGIIIAEIDFSTIL